MSVQRAMTPVATLTNIVRFASATSRASAYATRHFTSSFGGHSYTKRKLVTTSAYRPQSLDPSLPPRNSNVPETSISGAVPRIHDIRPPGPQAEIENASALSVPNMSITEKEAQKSKPTEILHTTSSETSTKPKRSKLRPRKAAMSLSSSAVEHLKLLLEQPDPKMIRVGVKNRGCSGLAYHLEYVEKPGTFDEAVEQDGVKVLIDSKALFSIIGSEMDWVEDKLNQRFVFKNPNIKEQCGCGESFMV
ncbi:MAG: hypothetical protein LQ340_006736 [Diploschistes diacapsis]|nr:MAG: hypothetical protein LQ340_006736 [Diploschistes diacapsis]